MRVLFVYPNIQKGAHTPQLGIASLSAVLKQHGHICDLYDVTVVPDGKEVQQFVAKVNTFRPDVIAYSIRSNEFQLVRAMLEAVPKDSIVSVAGGHHVTVAPEETLEIFDIGVRGDGESALLDIVTRLEAGRDITGVPNVWVRDGEDIIKNEIGPLGDIDDLPFPDWRLFDDIHFYQHYLLTGVAKNANVIGTFEGSRGCIFSCTYCSSPYVMNLYGGASWRREKSATRMADEINAFEKEFGLDFMYFVDEIFLTGVPRLREIRDTFRERVNKPFTFMERPELMTEEKVALIAEAGAAAVAIGVESGDEDFRKATLDRKMPQGKIVDAFNLAKAHGLHTHAFNMVGLPSESHDVIERNFNLLNQLKPDSFQVTIFYPLRGTVLQTLCKEKGYLESEDMPANYDAASVLAMPEGEGLRNDEIVRYQQLLSMLVGRNIPFANQVFRFLGRHPFLFRQTYILFLIRRLTLLPHVIRRMGWINGLKEIRRRAMAVIRNSHRRRKSVDFAAWDGGTDPMYDEFNLRS